MLLIAATIGIVAFDNMGSLIQMFEYNVKEIIFYGAGTGLAVVAIYFLLMLFLPERWYDDGGVNERVFQSLTPAQIPVACFFISFTEELLFRGIIQNIFGFVLASLLFAAVHFRYFFRPFLIFVTSGLSFLLGYLYLLTSNLWVPITVHFMIDFTFGLYYHNRNKTEVRPNEK